MCVKPQKFEPGDADAGQPESVASALGRVVRGAIVAQGGWLPFDRFMALALYEPGLGYYANGGQVLCLSNSDSLYRCALLVRRA